MKHFIRFLKGAYKDMTNKTAEVIEASKKAIIDISNDKCTKNVISNLFVGIGAGIFVAGVLIRIN